MKKTVKFSPKPEHIQAAKLVFLAKAMVETIRPVVMDYQNRILADHQWPIAEEWRGKSGQIEIITDPRHTYLLADSDFSEYLRLCNDARKAAGLIVESDEFCPLLVAEHDLIKAENAFIQIAAEDIAGIDPERIMTAKVELRDKFIDLTLRLLAPFIDTP